MVTRSSDDMVLAITFVAEAGKQMLESSPSVSEVEERLRRFLPAVGLEDCDIWATLSMIIISYWEPGQPQPVTIMREVNISEPRLERLAGTLSLLEKVEHREVDLDVAFEQLRTLGRAPGVRRVYARIAILVSVLGWVLFLNGLGTFSVVVALFATVLTFPIAFIISRLHLPAIAGTFIAAIVLAAVPNLLAGIGLPFSLAAAVVGGLFIYLPGRAFVSAVIDGLANAPVSAMARGLEATITAGALALGVVVGGQIGAGLGVELQVDSTATPLWLSIIGAAVGVLGFAVAWGTPRNRVAPTVVIGAMGWLVVALATRGSGGAGWAAYLLAAALVGFSSATVAYLQGGSASVYAGVAILPLVPGFALYQGMLALTQGTEAGASGSLGNAAVISLAIAGGVAIGLALGHNLEALGAWFALRLRRR